MVELQSYLVTYLLTPSNGMAVFHISDPATSPHPSTISGWCHMPFEAAIQTATILTRQTSRSRLQKSGLHTPQRLAKSISTPREKLHRIGAVKTLPNLVRAATARYTLLLPSVRKAHSPNKWCHNIICSQECPMGYPRSPRSNTLIKDKVNNSQSKKQY